MKRESGQSVLEFAFIFPILLIMLLAIFDIGKFVLVKMNVQTLASEIQKVASISLERNDRTTYKYAKVNGRDYMEQVDKIVRSNTNLDTDKVEVEIVPEEVVDRKFNRKLFDNYGDLHVTENFNRVQYYKVKVTYKFNTEDLISGIFLDDEIDLKHEYRSIVYLGSDGNVDRN